MTKVRSKAKTTTGRIHTKADKTLDLYLREIGETPLITAEREVILARGIHRGNKKALEELTKANLRFVVSVAKQYQNQGLSLSDLINEGNIGLIKAAKRFDEKRGFKFISYAVWWIRQSILQALAEQSRIVRLPLNRVGTLHKIGKAHRKIEQELGHTPTAEDIAKELKMSVEDVAHTLAMNGSYLSLDAPFSDGDSNSLHDILEDETQHSPDENIIHSALFREVEKVLITLSEREAEVIRLYFGIGRDVPLTLEEIGERFNLTRERVRQIKEKALRRLRHSCRSRALKAFITT